MTDHHGITFREATKVWLKIGLLSFGGPAGQIATMHRILVEELKWISEARFLHALNYCMLLPGPEAQQLTVYIGWLMHRTWGGLVAGLLFVLPGAIVMAGLSLGYLLYSELGWVEAIFFGIKAAVLAIVIEALIKIGKRALKNTLSVVVAALAFVAIFALNTPFPLIVLVAGLAGWIGAKIIPDAFAAKPPGTKEGKLDAKLDEDSLEHTRPSTRRAIQTILLWGTVWLAPLGLMVLIVGPDHVYAQTAAFFGKAAVVTFGGAYAVLAYVAQQAVDVYGWLNPGEMLDGLGLAETTPGPLILVLEFVGFLAGYRQSGLDPILGGFLGAGITLWATFAPCFLWIFLGAPYIEALRGNAALSAALGTITAAVVGVILNLAIWFGLHVIFTEMQPFHAGIVKLDLPVAASLDAWALGLSAAAMVALFKLRMGVMLTLGGCGIAGLLLHVMAA